MEREETAIIIAIFTLVFLSVIMITLFIIFQKRKNTLLLDQKEAEKRFESEVSRTKIEIREETFKNISWELHDNIGQLLTLAKIQLQNASEISEVKSTLDTALKELRTISKVINPDFLNKINLIETINLEIERLNRLKFIHAEVKIIGEEKLIDKKAEIVLFRIFQEFVSNTIKHAKASELRTIIDYQVKQLVISIKDNGKGFDISNQKNPGIGLINIESRAKLISASIIFKSEVKHGTSLNISYPYPS